MRKILTILIVILAIVLVGFFGWYLLSSNPDAPAGETFRNILPFGSGGDTSIPPTTDNRQLTTDLTETADEFANPAANLFRLSDIPVAGMTVFNRGNQTIVRYVDRATGHIYDADLATLNKVKVTNNTLPKIYEAYFRPDGNAVLLRSLGDNSDMVENRTLTLTPPQATSSNALHTVSLTTLRGDISAVAVGSGNTLIYALRDASTIISSAFNGTGSRTLLTSPFTDWRLVTEGNSLVVHTKASHNAPGYAYTLSLSNGAFAKILGPLNGLLVIPNTTGSRMLYSHNEGGKTRLFAKNIANNAISEILPTTLAEKCVWSTGNTGLLLCGAPTEGLGTGEPDRWYRGETHFSDRLWLFDTNLNTAKVLAEPRQSLHIDIDVLEPKLSPDGDYLVFLNKNDLSLWALRLE